MVAAIPTMQSLHLDLSMSPVDLPMFHDSTQASLHSIPSEELMLSQMFHTPSAVASVTPYLSSWEILPSTHKYSCLTCLDIKLSAKLYPLLEWALCHVSTTLAELVLHLGSSVYDLSG